MSDKKKNGPVIKPRGPRNLRGPRGLRFRTAQDLPERNFIKGCALSDKSSQQNLSSGEKHRRHMPARSRAQFSHRHSPHEGQHRAVRGSIGFPQPRQIAKSFRVITFSLCKKYAPAKAEVCPAAESGKNRKKTPQKGIGRGAV